MRKLMPVWNVSNHQPHVDVIQQHREDGHTAQHVDAIQPVPAMRLLGGRFHIHGSIIAAIRGCMVGEAETLNFLPGFAKQSF